MKKLLPKDILSLEAYEKSRNEIKQKVIEHKKNRSVMIHKHILLLFEDYDTIRYQVQEMLRIENITSKDEILDELNAYAPLIPDGNNLKATMLIMYPDVSMRKSMLMKLNGIENEIWINFDNRRRVFAIPDEDLERSNENKTSAVHFLRFQFDNEYVIGLKKSSKIFLGCSHSDYEQSVQLEENISKSLMEDLN